jgi:hypothetical protein
MTAAPAWNVWSVDTAESRALVVDEGAEHYSQVSAGRRNATARRLGIASLVFIALPPGQVPKVNEAGEIYGGAP